MRSDDEFADTLTEATSIAQRQQTGMQRTRSNSCCCCAPVPQQPSPARSNEIVVPSAFAPRAFDPHPPPSTLHAPPSTRFGSLPASRATPAATHCPPDRPRHSLRIFDNLRFTPASSFCTWIFSRLPSKLSSKLCFLKTFLPQLLPGKSLELVDQPLDVLFDHRRDRALPTGCFLIRRRYPTTCR